MITVKEFISQAEAAMLLSFLQDSEIDAILIDEYSAAATGAPFLVPIRLQVPDEQAEAARSFIAEFESSPLITDEGEISKDI
jgi:hypothetical protein